MSSGIMAIGETKNGRSGDAGGTDVHQAGGSATCDLKKREILSIENNNVTLWNICL
jgi:hypothetical protein